MDIEAIKPDLMVHARGKGSMQGVPGIHVGTVDHLDGKQWIKLKKDDSEDGQHHWIPVDWVEEVNDKAIHLKKTAAEFKRDLINERPKETH